MELSYENVSKTIEACMYPEEQMIGVEKVEDCPEGALIVAGVMRQFVFDPARVAEHRENIKSMLEHLETSFRASDGGGMSLMRMVLRSDGSLWGEQMHADLLYVLGNAAGYARFTLPRERWNMLPGGMPYVTIDLTAGSQNEVSAGESDGDTPAAASGSAVRPLSVDGAGDDGAGDQVEPPAHS